MSAVRRRGDRRLLSLWLCSPPCVLALALTASPASAFTEWAARRRHGLRLPRPGHAHRRHPAPPATPASRATRTRPAGRATLPARTPRRCPRPSSACSQECHLWNSVQKQYIIPQHARRQPAPRVQPASASAVTRPASASSTPAPARTTAGRPPGSPSCGACHSSPQKHAGKVACTRCHTDAAAFHLYQASSPGFKKCGVCHAMRHAGKKVATKQVRVLPQGHGTGPRRRSTPRRSPRSSCAVAATAQRLHASAVSKPGQELPDVPQRQVPRRAADARQVRVHGAATASPSATTTASRARCATGAPSTTRGPARSTSEVCCCASGSRHAASPLRPSSSPSWWSASGSRSPRTSTPQFCGACKSHVPYVDEWRASAHDGVNCEQCHTKPGPFFFLTAKLEALQQPIAQITGDYEKPILGTVLNQSCRRCHTNENLFKNLSLSGGIHRAATSTSSRRASSACAATPRRRTATRCRRARARTRPWTSACICHNNEYTTARRQVATAALRPLPHQERTTARARCRTRSPTGHDDHGAVGILSTCSACHIEKDACSKCHDGIEMPHPDAWISRTARRVEAKGRQVVRAVPRHQGVLQDLSPGEDAAPGRTSCSSIPRRPSAYGTADLLQLPRAGQLPGLPRAARRGRPAGAQPVRGRQVHRCRPARRRPRSTPDPGSE